MQAVKGNMGRCGAGDALSDYWRRCVSPREALELANVLRSMQKVAGHMGPNAGTVEYAGMSRGDAASILIDPSWVMGRYPVPARKIDILAGIVIHEALHRTEWSDHVWKLLEPDFTRMKTGDLIVFQKLVSTGEDIYVDAACADSIFGLYLAKARSRAVEESLAAAGGNLGSLDALMAMWTARTWGIPVVPCHDEILKALERIVEGLKEIRKLGGVLPRCTARADLFRSAWQDLSGRLEEFPAPGGRPMWSPDLPSPDPVPVPPAEARGHKPADGLPLCLVHEIAHHLATGSTDITPLIYSVVGYDHEQVAPTSRWNFPMPARPVTDQRLVGRLRSIFFAYSRHESSWSKGLPGGKIDGRRLYRAATDGCCFKERQIRPDLSWDVVLLIDASGSMRGVKWRIVENTTASLQRALEGFGGHFHAYAYFEADGICMISSLLRNGRLNSTIPAGRTASGQALIAAALLMPVSRRRKLLIHITDGEPNLGVEVRYGIECCAKRGIPLVTLGCGCRDRETMQGQYGGGIQFLDSFRQLTGALESLFRRVFLYGLNDRLNPISIPSSLKKRLQG